MAWTFAFDPLRRRSRRAWRRFYVPAPCAEDDRSLRCRVRRLAARLGIGVAALFPVLAAMWMVGGEQLAFAATELLPGSPERVEAQFARCGERGAVHCVVDGDTIRIGQRRIRLVGFDAPEIRGRCEAERLGAQRATSALQTWLNRGPFLMRVEAGTARIDRYGRDLRAALRGEGRLMEALSRYMVEGGFARRYGGGARVGWC